MPLYNELKHIGADTAFNRNWTVIQSVYTSKTGDKKKWEFICGCGSNQEFSDKDFLDPQEAAIAYREFHRCAADTANIDNNFEGEE